jgi:outer membrane protein OmpA-like peptidoglycan-associated protein
MKRKGEKVMLRSGKFGVICTLAFGALLVVSGCATKKYVREQVTGVDTRVSDLNNRTRENGERIDAVDQRAQTGITQVRQAAAAADTRAGQAQTAAQTAQTAAQGAQTSANTAQQTASAAQQSAATANNAVGAAVTRVANVESRLAQIDRYTVGPSQSVMFKVGSSVLDDAAKSTLDGIAGQVSSLASGFMLEVQGFASADGSEDANLMLSQRRAEVVQRYLVGKNVPLFRISLVGLGEDKPVADNKTRDGREQNRRVEVRVLRSN